MIQMKPKNMSPSGFTLIEMVVVVIIIAILAAIALPQYRRVMERTRAAEGINALGVLHRAQLAYRTRMGSFYDPFSAATWGALTAELEVDLEDPKYFTYTQPGAANPGIADAYDIQFARDAAAAAGSFVYNIRISSDSVVDCNAATAAVAPFNCGLVAAWLPVNP